MITPCLSSWTTFAQIILATLIVIGLTGCQTASKKDTPITFRVMTYNIHHGEGLDGKVDLLRIADVIKREHADIVALQEVDKGVARTARRDLPAELAALTGMTCVFSNNFHFQGGEYGNAVLSRFPVLRWTDAHYQMLRAGEQRGLLQLSLRVHGRELVFMNTHIDYRPDDSERLMNVGEIQAKLDEYHGRPVILAGDFNDNPGSRTHVKMKEQFDDAWELIGQGDGFSYPAEAPRKRIDYLWLSKDKSVVPVKAWVPESDASDHRPLVAEFRFR
jgi:endonuclease/exonuclease/phosphatase family metal-dependent hydrolase